MAQAKPMTSAEYYRWRFYAESLIEQAISILDAIDRDAEETRIWRTAGMASRMAMTSPPSTQPIHGSGPPLLVTCRPR